MIGTPAGTNGVRARAIAAPRRAASLARRVVRRGTSNARKSAGNAASSPQRAGSPMMSPNRTPRIVPPTQDAYSTTPEPSRTCGLKRPSGSAATAHVSSTVSWACRNRDHTPPVRDGATLIPIGAYRRFNRRAAVTAEITLPPTPRTAAEANCAEPAKVVADITTGASEPMPAARASTPKDTPKPATAMASGATARTPSRAVRSRAGSLIGWSHATAGLCSGSLHA